MWKRARVLWVALLVTIPTLIYAQFSNNTTSPYSRFGLGDLQPNSYGRTRAMGGAVIGSRYNQQINFLNPASYSSIDSMSFLFEFGFTARLSNYKSELSKMSTNDINFTYFAFSFPVTHWMASSFGLMPYSDSGYDVAILVNDENSGDVGFSYHGDGTFSKAYFGLAIKPSKYLSVGANLFYFFGKQSRYSEETFYGDADFYGIQIYDEIRLRDFGFNYGIQATLPLKNDQQITLGAILENKPTFTAFHTNIAQEILSSTDNTDVDTIAKSKIIDVKDIIEMPLSYGLGLSYSKKNKFEFNADYYFQQWSKANFFGSTNPILTDLNRFSFGGEWIPDKYSIRNYLNRVAYRAGMKFENYYLIFGNEQLKDFGISFGIGLPVYRSLSTVNLSAEIGKLGTTQNGLVREYYSKFTINVNIHDIWFIKRKFD